MTGTITIIIIMNDRKRDHAHDHGDESYDGAHGIDGHQNVAADFDGADGGIRDVDVAVDVGSVHADDDKGANDEDDDDYNDDDENDGADHDANDDAGGSQMRAERPLP